MSLIENIKKGLLWDFHGGVHPPENKEQTCLNAILAPEIPNELILPLKQHIGTAGKPIVAVGERVLKGQPLTETDSHHVCPIHAPTSGQIMAIESRTIPHPSGLSSPCIILEPDFSDTWGEKPQLGYFKQHSAEKLLEHIKQMGIAGLGGAGFPTARKIQSGLGRSDVLIINGVECEPYITADDRLMQEHADEIIKGCEILQHILAPRLILIAIEDNKPEAIKALQYAVRNSLAIQIKVIPTKYPSGGEKQLIQILTGKEIPTNQIPADIGILVQNVATVFAIKRAVIDGEPLISRVVTMVGQTLKQQANRWVFFGTKLEFLLEKHGFEQDKKLNRLIIGGPMMGFSAPHTQVPVSKTTNCLLLPSAKEIPQRNAELACIRCSACADVCPASLIPQQLYWYAKQKDNEQCQNYHLFDCIECGACAYVCPSEIPLVQYYRKAKADIRYQIAEQQASEVAKERFDAKKTRFEREKQARENRHKEAALARKQVMEQEQNQDAVAAAIARVKAKQAASLDAVSLDEKQKLRQERKQQAREYKADTQSKTQVNEAATAQNKKDAVAAAIARAKAKKTQQEQAKAEPSTETTLAEDSKKAAVAAAIARAKAKKAQQEQAEVETVAETALAEDSKKAAVNKANTHNKMLDDAAAAEQDKKATVAAAIARAKAKKAQQEQAKANASAEIAPAEDAKQAIADARAKAKKAAQEKTSVLEQDNSQQPSPLVANEDPKKAAIAAAVAKAKARKAEQEKKDK